MNTKNDKNQIPEPRYINGYWRNKQDQDAKPKEGQSTGLVPIALVTSCFLVLAVAYWQITLCVAGASGLIYGVHFYRKQPREARLRINYY